MQTLKLLVLFLSAGLFANAQNASSNSKVSWITLDEAANQLEKEKKPVLIDLYTDWCGWCKVMDKKTYSNKQVGEYVAQNFYSVKINAENQQSITWKGKTYNFNKDYKTNDFALYLTSGQLAYPTTVIIPSDGSAPQAIPGYLSPRDLELVVKYFGEEEGYGKIPFDQYQKKFKASW